MSVGRSAQHELKLVWDIPSYLATYADLRLQFGKLLLVHYELLHL